jgi:hypothetical protein
MALESIVAQGTGLSEDWCRNALQRLGSSVTGMSFCVSEMLVVGFSLIASRCSSDRVGRQSLLWIE